MSTLGEQREAVVKEALELIEKAKAGDEAAFVAAEAKSAELKTLDAKIALGQKGDELARSLGGSPRVEVKEREEDPFRKFADTVRSGAKGRMELPRVKANTDPTTTGGPEGTLLPWYTQYQSGIVEGFRRRPSVTDLIPQTATTSQVITYLIEGALEGDFASVAEGATKAQLHVVNPTPVSDPVRKVAGYTKVSDETFKDLPVLISHIRSKLLYRLSIVEEDLLLNGDGTGTDISGILDRAIGTETSTDSDENVDSIYRAITAVQTETGFSPDGIVINPVDYEEIRLRKDLNNQYYGGGFFQNQYGTGGLQWQPPIWGVPTVVTPVIAEGTVLVGAFQQSSTLYRNGGVTIETTNSNEDDFINNLVTILAETRLALAVTHPLGFVAVDLSAS